MTINRRDVLLGAAGLPFGGAMANDYMSDDPWLDSGGEHDSQQVSLVSLSRRLVRAEEEMRRMRKLMATHGILDSNSDAQSPHPNLNVSSLNFGNGSGMINGVGVQLVALSLKNILAVVPSFRTTAESLSVAPMAVVSAQASSTIANWIERVSYSSGDEASVYLESDSTEDLALLTSSVQSGAAARSEIRALGSGGTGPIVSAQNDVTDWRIEMTGAVVLRRSSSTIASGVIVAQTSSHMRIDTEAAAATDDLDTITSTGEEGQVLIIRAANSARTVVAKDGTGNLKLAGDCTLDNAEDTLMLIYDGTNWLELSRSDNGA